MACNGELYNIRLGDTIYYIQLWGDHLRSGTVARINYGTAFQPDKGNVVTLEDGQNCYFDDFGSLWFHDKQQAEEAFAKLHEGHIQFGDIVRVIPRPDETTRSLPATVDDHGKMVPNYGVVCDVSYVQDSATRAIGARYEVALRDRRIRNLTETDLERVGTAFSETLEITKAGEENIKRALLAVIDQFPRWRKKRQIKKKELAEIIKTAEQVTEISRTAKELAKNHFQAVDSCFEITV